jgi:hypothetical protein
MFTLQHEFELSTQPSIPSIDWWHISVNLLDESGEIRATGFNDAVDKYYEMLELNKVWRLFKYF